MSYNRDSIKYSVKSWILLDGSQGIGILYFSKIRGFTNYKADIKVLNGVLSTDSELEESKHILENISFEDYEIRENISNPSWRRLPKGIMSQELMNRLSSEEYYYLSKNIRVKYKKSGSKPRKLPGTNLTGHNIWSLSDTYVKEK